MKVRIVFAKLLFCCCLAAITTLNVLAQEPDYSRAGVDKEGHIPYGLKIGEKAPDFIAMDRSGREVALSKLWEKQPVVIIFYRGVWCPVCMRYLSNLQDSLQEIESRGAIILAVTPEVDDRISKTKDNTGAEFVIISDSSEQIMRDYDVWFNVTEFYQTKVNVGRLNDIARNNGQDEAILPVPATYIIGKSGTILYRQFDINYKNRASVKDILEHLPQ